jgi:hypothetical protein
MKKVRCLKQAEPKIFIKFNQLPRPAITMTISPFGLFFVK